MNMVLLDLLRNQLFSEHNANYNKTQIVTKYITHIHAMGKRKYSENSILFVVSLVM